MFVFCNFVVGLRIQTGGMPHVHIPLVMPCNSDGYCIGESVGNLAQTSISTFRNTLNVETVSRRREHLAIDVGQAGIADRLHDDLADHPARRDDIQSGPGSNFGQSVVLLHGNL